MNNWNDKVWVKNLGLVLKYGAWFAAIGLFVMSLFPEAAAAGILTMMAGRV